MDNIDKKNSPTITSVKLIDMLKDAISICGDRPVFVEINGKRYLINDLEFTMNGASYTLILNNVILMH